MSCLRKWLFVYMSLVASQISACSSEADQPVVRPRPQQPVYAIRVHLNEIPDPYTLLVTSVETLHPRKNLLDHPENLYSAYRGAQVINKHFDLMPMNLMAEYVYRIECMPTKPQKEVNFCNMHRKEIDMEFIHRIAYLVLRKKHYIGHLTDTIIASYKRTLADM
jgi:hypothetical protein